MKRKVSKNIKLTDSITYRILDNTIYLFNEDNNISLEEWEVVYKKIVLLVEDNDISYINFSTKEMEKRKGFYQKLGFTLSYYDVNKLNYLYGDVKNKKMYKCYGIMTKNDFLNRINDDKENAINNSINIISSNSGFVSNMLLLFFGISLLCYFCIQGAIYLVK